MFQWENSGDLLLIDREIYLSNLRRQFEESSEITELCVSVLDI